MQYIATAFLLVFSASALPVPQDAAQYQAPEASPGYQAPYAAPVFAQPPPQEVGPVYIQQVAPGPAIPAGVQPPLIPAIASGQMLPNYQVAYQQVQQGPISYQGASYQGGFVPPGQMVPTPAGAVIPVAKAIAPSSNQAKGGNPLEAIGGMLKPAGNFGATALSGVGNFGKGLGDGATG
ncbi:hypothetical protein BC830DRAFT_1158457, partial [Chytriomyces sp. MP71]